MRPRDSIFKFRAWIFRIWGQPMGSFVIDVFCGCYGLLAGESNITPKDGLHRRFSVGPGGCCMERACHYMHSLLLVIART